MQDWFKQVNGFCDTVRLGMAGGVAELATILTVLMLVQKLVLSLTTIDHVPATLVEIEEMFPRGPVGLKVELPGGKNE